MTNVHYALNGRVDGWMEKYSRWMNRNRVVIVWKLTVPWKVGTNVSKEKKNKPLTALKAAVAFLDIHVVLVPTQSCGYCGRWCTSMRPTISHCSIPATRRTCDRKKDHGKSVTVENVFVLTSTHNHMKAHSLEIDGKVCSIAIFKRCSFLELRVLWLWLPLFGWLYSVAQNTLCSNSVCMNLRLVRLQWSFSDSSVACYIFA